MPINVPESTGGVIAGKGSIGLVGAGGMIVAGLGSGSLTACALSAKVTERTAAAQSAIAEVKKCDFVFMTRTLSAVGKQRQRGAGNAIVTLVAEQVRAAFKPGEEIGLTSRFTKGNARICLFFPGLFFAVAGNSRVTSQAGRSGLI